MILNLILHAFLSVSSNGDSGSTTHYVQYELAIVTGKQIGRASCRERVSSPV